MRTSLAYDGPEGEPFEVPDERVAGELAPRNGSDLHEDAHYREALDDPMGAERLRDAAASARRVLLIVDDATRGTPVARILPHVARELHEAGVPDEDVTVLTAQGTHRRMTEEELDRKVGPDLRRRWRVEQHDYRDEASLVRVGETRDGMPVVVNRLLEEHDLRVGVGHVGVHGIMGYSGGAKIVIPGVAGAASERWTHWNASLLPVEDLMGRFESPIRLAMEEGVRLAGLDAVLNVVMDHRGRVQRAAYGDFVVAQRACARTARDLYEAQLRELADVVVVEATPADRDYWQSVKGLYAGTLCVREGGVLVLVAPNPEGVARNHPNVLELAGRSADEIRGEVESGRVDDVIGAAVAHFTARFRERHDVVIVSSGVAPREARALGFTPAPTPQAGVDEALRRAGSGARVAVVRGGGGVLPVVEGRNAQVLRAEREAARPPRHGPIRR